ncbi:hypothetical protein BKA56DRAFT_367009 [Ilyonectria sp. MPI-CAGE-AT-0026]|nr:hypothetical protein BKA56DRAFT_367009 [Ilyonectria sp. MPI-CAGE-AT-0026]
MRHGVPKQLRNSFLHIVVIILIIIIVPNPHQLALQGVCSRRVVVSSKPTARLPASGASSTPKILPQTPPRHSPRTVPAPEPPAAGPCSPALLYANSTHASRLSLSHAQLDFRLPSSLTRCARSHPLPSRGKRARGKKQLDALVQSTKYLTCLYPRYAVVAC